MCAKMNETVGALAPVNSVQPGSLRVTFYIEGNAASIGTKRGKVAMRFAVLADIHGNLPALEAVMADLAHFAVEQVVVAGDLINWGPDSAAVVEQVTAAGWAALRGNNEYYLLDAGTPRAPAQWAEWQL